jgi:hypothetical protein
MHTFDDDGWELENAEERHARSPDRFLIPSQEERSALSVGDRVKQLFLFLNQADDGSQIIDCERMWVAIQGKSGGRYDGELLSEPATSTAIVRGARISFGPEHIASVMVELEWVSRPRMLEQWLARTGGRGTTTQSRAGDLETGRVEWRFATPYDVERWQPSEEVRGVASEI